MNVACLAFTEKGFALAEKLAKALGGQAYRSGQPQNLHQWTQQHFPQEQALIYVGAVGIAVRAIAPYLQSKTTDPAVVAVDECAHFAVPVVSGHLGGANDLARRIAELCGAVPVITTATDAHGVFAVDEWARSWQCAVIHTERIRYVSGALLAGRAVRIKTEFPVSGDLPKGILLTDAPPWDVYLGFTPQPEEILWLVPRTVVLGIGCRRGVPAEILEKVWNNFNMPAQSVCQVASIDLKAQEPGLHAFCRAHGWPVQVYSAAQLAAVKGQFSASLFVEKTTGVDNVCERAAVLASGGVLLRKKMAEQCVTMAAAGKLPELNWSVHHGW